VSAAVAAEQQRIADRFHALGLIPKPIDVRAIVWTPPAS
jgi:sulfonate transport system substrate-binding protein